MKRRIFKYEVTAGTPAIDFPGYDHKILDVQFQEGSACIQLWAEVTPGQPNVARQIRIVGTGHHIPASEKFEHLKTVQQGIFVWHVYIEKLPENT